MLVRLGQEVQEVPRGLSPGETVRAALESLREQDLPTLSALLHPEVEVEGLKGDFRGIDAVLRWATVVPSGELRSRVELDRVVELTAIEVAAAARRQWRWREGDELADETEFGILFTFRDGLIYRWRQRFETFEEAVAAAAEPEPEG